MVKLEKHFGLAHTILDRFPKLGKIFENFF